MPRRSLRLSPRLSFSCSTLGSRQRASAKSEPWIKGLWPAETNRALLRIAIEPMKKASTLSVIGGFLLSLVACHAASTERVQPEASAVTTSATAMKKAGTDPGHVGRGTPLAAREGDELAA